MAFKTKLDFSNNRQVKQNIKTITVLSGSTSFGVPFSSLQSGPDLTTTGITSTSTFLLSTFSGNSATTVYSWYDPFMETAISSLVPITPANSGITQNASGFTGNPYILIDGNYVAATYTGITFDLTPIAISDLGGGNYIGSVQSDFVEYYSASTLDFTGRTIWNDVSGITRTERLIITNTPQVGYVLGCIDSEGMSGWVPLNSGGTGSSPISIVNTNNLFSTRLVGTGAISSGVTNSIFFGVNAGNNATGASGSNFLGNEAGSGATNANDSNFLGYFAGRLATNASYSNFFGYNVGYGVGSNNNIGSNNVIIGTNISLPNNTSNSINIGGVLFGSGTYSAISGNPSITGQTQGRIGVNIVSPTETLDIAGNARIRTIGSLSSSGALYYTSSGVLTTNTSDSRLKNNIQTLTNSLDKIKQLRGVSYNWVGEDGPTRIGFIAQEVQSVVPELTFINNNSPEKYVGVHYDNTVALLVEAIKELSSGLTISNNTHLETQTILAEDNNIDLNYNGTVETAIGGGITVLHSMGVDLSAELITDNNGNWVTNNDFIPNKITIPNYTPSGSTDMNGNLGNITRDDDYLYLKGSTGWKRINLENF